jgi:hypothetical protein
MGGFGQLYPKGAPPFPPLDLAYLAASLAGKGHSTRVVEAGAQCLDIPETCDQLRSDPALGRTLVLVRTSLPTIDWDLDFCATLRRIGPIGGLALFGPAAPSLRQRIEQDTSLDFVILTEADGPALELMSGTPPASIPGLMYRTEGAWRRTADRSFEKNLDALPFPRWDLLPVDCYVIPKSSGSGKARFLPMLSSRGCPFGCSYCPYPVGQGLKWRYRSPANVVDEMEHLVRDFQVEHILFRDPMFSAQQKRVIAICEEILRRGLTVRWKCETRIDCLDEPTIVMMAKAGCVGVNFGVESIDPEIQKGVHRTPILMEDFLTTVAQCRAQGIGTFAFFVVGLPGDTVDTIMRSIEFAARIRADWTQFTVATPFIGTPMYDWAVREGFVASDAYRIVNAHEHSVGNENLTPADIKRLHEFAQFLQNNVLNRRGVLKNRTRKSVAYRTLKSGADVVSYAVAVASTRLAGVYFRRTVRLLPPRPRVQLDGSRPVSAAKP